MSKNVNSLVGTTLLCHCWETNNIFSIGGLVQPGDTLTAAAIRHCHHVVNFRIKHNDRLYIAKELDAFMDHELVKITILINDVLCGRRKWRLPHSMSP